MTKIQIQWLSLLTASFSKSRLRLCADFKSNSRLVGGLWWWERPDVVLIANKAEHFQRRPHKIVKHAQKKLRLFDHFVGLALNGLTLCRWSIILENISPSSSSIFSIKSVIDLIFILKTDFFFGITENKNESLLQLKNWTNIFVSLF